MTIGYGTSSNFGTLTNFNFLFFSSIWMYSGVSLSLFANKERETPEYIQMDEKNKKLKFVRVPKFEEVPYPIVMEPNLVIEYYSR